MSGTGLFCTLQPPDTGAQWIRVNLPEGVAPADIVGVSIGIPNLLLTEDGTLTQWFGRTYEVVTPDRVSVPSDNFRPVGVITQLAGGDEQACQLVSGQPWCDGAVVNRVIGFDAWRRLP